MFERFTDRARKVMQLANLEAQRFNHEYIGTEHILLGLVKEGSGVAATVLQTLHADLRRIRLEVERMVEVGPDEVQMGKLPPTPRAKKVCEYAIEEARTLNHKYVGTEHLLLGLLREAEGVGAQVLMNLGIDLEQVRQEVLALLGHGDDPTPPARSPSSRLTKEQRQELRGLPRQAQETIRELDARLGELQHAKDEAVAAEEFEKAAQLRNETDTLKKQREEVLRTWRGRKQDRIWEYEVHLPAGDDQASTGKAIELIRQRLLEQFGMCRESTQQVLGAMQVAETSLTGLLHVFHVFSRNDGQAIACFSKLREELAKDEPPRKIVILGRKVEVL